MRGKPLARSSENERERRESLHDDLERPGHSMLEFAPKARVRVERKLHPDFSASDLLCHTGDRGGDGAELGPWESGETQRCPLPCANAAECGRRHF